MAIHKIGVFGASFNPPTKGHLDVIKQALPFFDEILLVPSASHPFQKKLIPFEHRFNMCQLLMDDMPQANERAKLTLSDIEKHLNSQAPNSPVYTFDVLLALEKVYSEERRAVQLSFILGPDNREPSVWQRFYRSKEIEQRWPLFVAKERMPIHSTSVRENLREAQDSDAQTLLSLMVPKAIADYILIHQLYTQ